MLHMIIEAS